MSHASSEDKPSLPEETKRIENMGGKNYALKHP